MADMDYPSAALERESSAATAAAIHDLLVEMVGILHQFADYPMHESGIEILRIWERIADPQPATLAAAAARIRPVVSRLRLRSAPLPDAQDREALAAYLHDDVSRNRFEDVRSALASALARLPLAIHLETAHANQIAPYTESLLRDIGWMVGTIVLITLLVAWAFAQVVVLLIAVVVLILWGAWRWRVATYLRQRAALAETGARCLGTILRRHKHGAGFYEFTMSYCHEGLDFATPGAVSSRLFHELSDGDQLPLMVDREQPNLWMVAGSAG